MFSLKGHSGFSLFKNKISLSSHSMGPIWPVEIRVHWSHWIRIQFFRIRIQSVPNPDTIRSGSRSNPFRIRILTLLLVRTLKKAFFVSFNVFTWHRFCHWNSPHQFTLFFFIFHFFKVRYVLIENYFSNDSSCILMWFICLIVEG